MRLVLQIFRKDVERLRWPIVLTLALLAYWTFRDATLPWGADPRLAVSGGESWMNLALPFAWAVLIALAIQEDSLVGDRQFWVALPCGWKPLIAAKAMFVAAFIHVPYFLATAIILAARGFNPAGHLPHLFWKQLVLLALTIPALGAATLVKNVAHFPLLAIVLASVVVLRIRDVNAIDSRMWVWDIRWELALIVVAGGAFAVAILQFAGCRTRVSRAAGIAAATAAVLLYSWIPRNATAAISAAFSPAKDHVTVRLAGEGPARPDSPWSQVTTVSLPLVLEGGSGEASGVDPVTLEIIAADGSHYDVTPATAVNPAAKDPAVVALFPAGPGGQLRADLYFTSPRMWDRVRHGKVTLRGHMIVEYARAGAGEIHCRNSVPSQFPGLSSTGLVECESVELGGRNVRFGGRGLAERRFSLSHFPADPWLSPIHRLRALHEEGGASIHAEPYVPRGFEVVDYTIPDLDLNQFVGRTR
ncbi:MAG TPA: hypothetical protein VHC72_04600 [Bryobacteraceae bacterium]|nr:hypothetical protein [Bryobacteraceae bacterium]